MARYVATQPIYFGSALAFAAGQQVPEGHVERFGYLDAGMVAQVDDDHRGDAPHLAPAPPDNAPPSLTPDRYLDKAAQRVEQAQRDFAAAQGPPAADGKAAPIEGDTAANGRNAPAAPTASKSGAAKAKPGTGDTNNPVKEG